VLYQKQEQKQRKILSYTQLFIILVIYSQIFAPNYIPINKVVRNHRDILLRAVEKYA